MGKSWNLNRNQVSKWVWISVESLKRFKSGREIRPHKLKQNHQSWHPNKWMRYLCRNFDLAFLEFVWLRSVAKSKMWNFLDEESAHYFQFFNHLKEKKTFFESSFLKKAEKTAFESQIIKKNLMAVLGFRTNIFRSGKCNHNWVIDDAI